MKNVIKLALHFKTKMVNAMLHYIALYMQPNAFCIKSVNDLFYVLCITC